MKIPTYGVSGHDFFTLSYQSGRLSVFFFFFGKILSDALSSMTSTEVFSRLGYGRQMRVVWELIP